jgi:hypothetical protein
MHYYKFYQLLQELVINIIFLSRKGKFHLEVLHQYKDMMIYLSYPSHGTQHPTLNASQNRQAFIIGNMLVC